MGNSNGKNKRNGCWHFRRSVCWWLGLWHWKGCLGFQAHISGNLATWKCKNTSGVVRSEEPRHRFKPGMMKWGLAQIFGLSVFILWSYESSFCGVSYRCHLLLFRYCNVCRGGNNRTECRAFCISTYAVGRNAGRKGREETRASSYWFPPADCWMLRAGPNPWRKLSCSIYVTGFDIPVCGRPNQGARGKGKAFTPPTRTHSRSPPLQGMGRKMWKDSIFFFQISIYLAFCFPLK